MKRAALALPFLVLGGCERGELDLSEDPPPEQPPPIPDTPTDTTPVEGVTVTDEGLASGYQDTSFGTWQRGRGAIVADFDDDGRMDVVAGNPGDVSYILHNVTSPGAVPQFETGQVLTTEIALWGGTAVDLDNDCDVDLYAGVGGNETPGFDQVWMNDGTGALTDESLSAGAWQVRPNGEPFENSTASALAWDFDNDGLLDVFANSHVPRVGDVGSLTPKEIDGLNALWHNQGDGTFVDMGRTAGFDEQFSTRNSTWLDFDHDNDLDLFENNWVGRNILWSNQLTETGNATFEDVTEEYALGGGDLAFPYDLSSMCAIASDLNQDGFDDIIVFRRWPKEEAEPEVHGNTHLVWINVEGTGFVEVSAHTALADALVYRDHGGLGVMGCQVGDIDADGMPDLFMGNGGPDGGQTNQLFVSAGARPFPVDIDGVGEVMVPSWEDWSELIDFPPPYLDEDLPEGDEAPGYPFRTHGTIMADLDGDGLNELGVHNGGPSTWGTDEEMQEPNRLFKFHLDEAPHWLRVELVGDGDRVNMDGIGARIRAVVSEGNDGETWEVFGTRRSSTGFGAQNQPDVLLGLGHGDTVHEVEITWPDGVVQTVENPRIDRYLTIHRGWACGPDIGTDTGVVPD